MFFKLLIVICFLLAATSCFSQQRDSISIKKTFVDWGVKRSYSTVTFDFFYININKPITIVALNIDDIRLATDHINGGNGIIRVYLADKTYKVFVKYEPYWDSRIYDLTIDTNYDYNVTLYLSNTMKPIEPYPADPVRKTKPTTF